jgi:hypothetical protein
MVDVPEIVQEHPDHPGPFIRPGVQDAGTSSTASVHVVERRILEHPTISAPPLVITQQAFKAYGEELRRINDRSKQCDEFIDFLDQMAAGLADLADALDRAFATTTPEPVLTKEAAEKARQLCLKLLAWRAKIGTDAIDVPGIRVGLFLGGALFERMRWFGSDRRSDELINGRTTPMTAATISAKARLTAFTGLNASVPGPRLASAIRASPVAAELHARREKIKLL